MKKKLISYATFTDLWLNAVLSFDKMFNFNLKMMADTTSLFARLITWETKSFYGMK